MEPQQPICPESTIESANERRGFLKKAALITGAAVVGSTILGNKVVSKLVPESSATSGHIEYCCPTGTAIEGDTCSGIGVRGFAPGSGRGVVGCTYTGTAVCGLSFSGAGVKGSSYSGPGVQGCAITYCCFGTLLGGCKPGVCGSSHSGPGVQGKSCSGPGVEGKTCSGTGVLGIATTSGTAVVGISTTGTAVLGISTTGTAVLGCSTTGTAVLGCSTTGTAVFGCATTGAGVEGRSSSGPGVEGVAGTNKSIPLVAKGAVCQCSPLTEWQNSSGTALSVVNKKGYFGINKTSACNPLCVSGKIAATGLGIGTTTPATALQVNGGISAKVAAVTSNYSMSATDFGVLANATSGSLTVTLPSAGTALGMIVFIKKVDSSANAVKVVAVAPNLIEGSSSQVLSAQFASLYLISDGNSNWYMIANENVESSYGRA